MQDLKLPAESSHASKDGSMHGPPHLMLCTSRLYGTQDGGSNMVGKARTCASAREVNCPRLLCLGYWTLISMPVP